MYCGDLICENWGNLIESALRKSRNCKLRPRDLIGWATPKNLNWSVSIGDTDPKGLNWRYLNWELERLG